MQVMMIIDVNGDDVAAFGPLSSEEAQHYSLDIAKRQEAGEFFVNSVETIPYKKNLLKFIRKNQRAEVVDAANAGRSDAPPLSDDHSIRARFADGEGGD